MGDNDELIRRVNEVRWFHSIPLREGLVTPGEDNSMDKLGQVCLSVTKPYAKRIKQRPKNELVICTED